MKAAIVGAGAIGSTFAWHLARGRHDVVVVDVWREHVEAIARNGLALERADGRAEAVELRATTDAARAGTADLVLVATKAFATEEAARAAALCTGPATWVATVQNGLGNDLAIARVLGPERVLPGSTTVAAEIVAPGRVRVGAATAAGRSLTSLGRPRTAAEMPGGVLQVCTALSAAGLPAEALDDVDFVIWRKLALAASMAPLAAVLGLTVAQVLDNPAAAALLHRALEEIVAVARACGVALDLDETRRHALATFESIGPHPPSMAVDLAAGRRTEIEAMCLRVADLGRGHGVATPVNEVVGELVRAIETGRP